MSGQMQTLDCPHCGNTTPHTCEALVDPYAVMRCSTCSEPSIYRDCVDLDLFGPKVHETLFFTEVSTLVWPSRAELHPAVPRRVQQIYKEAAGIRRKSPNGFANQIRRAVEAICKDQGERTGSLADKIKRLADAGVIPGALADMTEFLRKLGNAGSHDDESEDVDPSYVDPIDDFFRAVIEYVYIAPWKIAEFKAQLANARQQTIGD